VKEFMKALGFVLLFMAVALIGYTFIKMLPDWENLLWWAQLVVISVASASLGALLISVGTNQPAIITQEKPSSHVCPSCGRSFGYEPTQPTQCSWCQANIDVKEVSGKRYLVVVNNNQQPTPNPVASQDETIYCHKCGTKLTSEMDYCQKCGMQQIKTQ